MATARERVREAQDRLRAAVAEREAGDVAGVGRHERMRRAMAEAVERWERERAAFGARPAVGGESSDPPTGSSRAPVPCG